MTWDSYNRCTPQSHIIVRLLGIPKLKYEIKRIEFLLIYYYYYHYYVRL